MKWIWRDGWKIGMHIHSFLVELATWLGSQENLWHTIIYIYILYIMYIYIYTYIYIHIYIYVYILYIYVCRSISIYIYIYHRYLYLSLCACTKSATFVEPVLAVCEASRLRTCRMSNSPPAALLGRCSPNDISKAFGIGVLPLNRLQCWDVDTF